MATPFLMYYKIKRFAHIVIQKDTASRDVGRNIQRKPEAIKKKITGIENPSWAEMLRDLSWKVFDLTLPQLLIKATCSTQQLLYSS